MSIYDDLKVRGFTESMLPDVSENIYSCLNFDGDFVVSRHHDGRVLSKAEDPVWDLSPYDAKGYCKHNFQSWTKNSQGALQIQLAHEMKAIQLVRFNYHRSPRKVNTIKLSGLRRLAQLCEKNNFSLLQLFNDSAAQSLFLSSLANLGNQSVSRDLLMLSTELYHLRVVHPNFELAPADYSLIEEIGQLAGSYSEYRKSFEQTKLIPSRIYGAFIVGFGDELDFFNEHAESCVELARRRKDGYKYGDAYASIKHASGGVYWEDAAVECGLEQVCERFSIKGLKDFYSYLNSVSYIAKTWIHLFSGMRDNEARTLPANTLTTIRVGDEQVTILRGFTSKTVGQNNVSTCWVSSPIVERAIAAAKAIGRIAAIRYEWDDSDESNYPLFPKLAHVRKNTLAHLYSTPVMSGKSGFLVDRLLARIPSIEVTEGDIVELERFDGFKDWRSDRKVIKGQPWPLASHQCRRSLAVYSARSGVVGLGSLANQYKHLTETMTSYYRSDQVFAENFLSLPDQQAFMREMEFERRIASMFNYEKDVINSSGRLWGGEGNRIQVSRDRGKPLIIITDREATARKFEKGEMVYKESPLGGCTNLDSCDKIGFISIFACLDCQYAVLDSNKSIRKIRYGISNLQESRGMFPPSSPFYKQLSLEIDTVYQQVERAGFGHEIEDLK